MKRLNCMNFIHDNEVNKISEYNLLHDILNPPKRNTNMNIHYSPILHGCMNAQKGRDFFSKSYWIVDVVT